MYRAFHIKGDHVVLDSEEGESYNIIVMAAVEWWKWIVWDRTSKTRWAYIGFLTRECDLKRI